MKKNLILFTFVISLVLFNSCSNDSDDDTGPINNPPDTSVTYDNSVKSIIDSNCTSCHGNPLTNNAPMPLLTLNNVKEAVQNRKFNWTCRKWNNATKWEFNFCTNSSFKRLANWRI